MTEVGSFEEIAEEFQQRVSRIVWCTVATVDGRGRPRSRILHPVWDGSIGWIATGRHSFKAKHIAQNPYVSLSYWDQQHQQVYAECRAEWEDDPAEKQRVWDMVKNAPPPVGYDPGLFWQGGPSDPEFGALKLTPWRVELWALPDMVQGKQPLVWRQKGS
ncbi:MAG TPA: pyridoxamine 5'-phosphate oxidase family protein [Tepidiformaceae bacterium]|nr:pyridoxamine 5'-phosphate oxidase family protein [Tepidiformaceae bacterium]